MKTILTIILAFYCTGLSAATAVDLFDENRGQEKKSEPVNQAPTRSSKIRSIRRGFSLTGISKIGDKHVIYFDSTKGQRNNFTWHEQQKSAATKIYDDYEIAKIIDRTVYLNIITSKPCIADQKKGISCDQKNKQMIMQLVRKKAIAPTSSSRANSRGTRKPATQAATQAAKKPVTAAKKRPRNFPFKQKLKNK